MPIKRSANPQIELPVFCSHGIIHTPASTNCVPQLHYELDKGKLYLGDATTWLRSLESESVDLVFADPPYNIKKADWDDFKSMHHYVEWSGEWISEAARVLKPYGTLFVCGFSEIIAEIKVAVAPLFASCRWLIWHYKNKANLGKDWGRSHESIIHFRKGKSFVFNIDQIRIPYSSHTLKYPEHPQAETSQYSKGSTKAPAGRDNWMPHPQGAKPKDVIDIPTTCNGMEEKSPHPTQKPEELLRKLILASSNIDDLVVDPFSGSGTTLVVAEQLGRRWMGCDLEAQHNEWAIQRLERVPRKSVDDWIEFDRKNALRRESIR
jgi:site-specific DNA-methyltransferase (adenine-specific)